MAAKKRKRKKRQDSLVLNLLIIVVLVLAVFEGPSGCDALYPPHRRIHFHGIPGSAWGRGNRFPCGRFGFSGKRTGGFGFFRLFLYGYRPGRTSRYLRYASGRFPCGRRSCRSDRGYGFLIRTVRRLFQRPIRRWTIPTSPTRSLSETPEWKASAMPPALPRDSFSPAWA